jgi:purine-nucleoside phosphorylase
MIHTPSNPLREPGALEREQRARFARLAEALAQRGVREPAIQLVLGSGLGAFAERLEQPISVPYEELPDLPRSAVPGHAGRFVFGRLAGVPVLCCQGRVHLYEGWGPFDVTAGVRAGALLGARVLILTNAAGGLDPDFEPGTLMLIRDQVAAQGESALFPSEFGRGSPYSPLAAQRVLEVAAALQERLAQGTYVALRGPAYETPAEVRAWGALGAQAVGMSTALEAQVGYASGLAVLGLSCITNKAAGLSSVALSHAEVVEVGRQTSARFARLIESSLPALSRLPRAQPEDASSTANR